jgi:hypothetical protein
VATQAASLKKKMISHLPNDVVLANYALVLRFVIFFLSNYTLIGFNLSI